MQRKQLSKKDIKGLNLELEERYGLDDFLDKKADAELSGDIIRVDSQPSFFYQGDELIPTLKLILKNNFLKTATVDMPAVPFVAGGADVMRPGIKEMDDFRKGDMIAVVDENNRRPLAICRAEFSSEEIRSMDKGKVLKNIHHVGDRIWES